MPPSQQEDRKDHPKTALTRRLERHVRRLDRELARLAALDQRFVRLRGWVLLVGSLASAWALFGGEGVYGPYVLGFFVLLFAGVVAAHRRVDAARLRFRLAREGTAELIARQRLDWSGIPAPLPVVVSGEHPFAADLSVTGVRSLHALLDTATSRGGSLRLAEWLLEPEPSLEAISRRQALVRELLPLTGFRRRLALKGLLVKEKAGGRWDSDRLIRWLELNPGSGRLLPWLALLTFLALLNLVLLALNLLGVLPLWWAVSLAVYAGLYLYKFRDYASLFEDAYQVGEALDQFRGILRYLERYPYPPGGKLQALCRPYLSRESRPSGYLKRIVWITSAASLGSNQFLALVFNAVAPWNLFFAHLMNRYKAGLHTALLEWLDVWYELEALNSLANYLYLNPGYSLPRVRPEGQAASEPVFQAREMGHPLLPDSVRVANDFTLDSLDEAALITGSNMSGKSTFLRTLGTNLVLAYAGSAVPCASLDVIRFRVFTCIQVADSLDSGISYFYAEVKRLKALLDALEQEQRAPVFFLIDEIFRGTNNRERRAGSQAYVRALVSRRGAGAISTHDLELAHLADEGGGIHNYHFREEVLDGRMAFDYRLRRGPSPTTNALKIMEMEGLPVA